MNAWRQTLVELRRSRWPAVLVSVESTVGSSPREPGARMIVTADRQYGTIGGGNLEHQACAIARELLDAGEAHSRRRFPLGAGLGQCCGGLVNLEFERLDRDSAWRKAEVEDDASKLYLFGAGHVGSALVRALTDLPFNIHWIDTRDDVLPPEPPPGLDAICTDTPEAEIDQAPPGSFFLVMTHDHALDQKLCEQVLQRDDFVYFGLIGSRSKRRLFETRMRRRGVDPRCFERMTCPIGIDGIRGKQPAQIALAVAAELLRVRDRLQASADAGQPLRSLGKTS